MNELQDKKLFAKIQTLYHNILNLKKLDVDNYYCAELLNWFNEVVYKNISIFKSRKMDGIMDQELYKKKRQHVYWINFGRNIGSEFNDYHFALVVYEAKRTAIVVPLTSKKNHDPKWIEEHKNVIIELDGIDGFPEGYKECIACVFMLQSVSKKRLDRYGNKKEGYYDLKVSDEQMDLICQKICDIINNSIDK